MHYFVVGTFDTQETQEYRSLAQKLIQAANQLGGECVADGPSISGETGERGRLLVLTFGSEDNAKAFLGSQTFGRLVIEAGFSTEDFMLVEGDSDVIPEHREH